MLDPSPFKRRRGDEQALEGLRVLEKGSLKDKIEQGIREGSPHYRPLSFVAVQFGASLEEARALAGELEQENKIVRIAGDLYLHRDFCRSPGQAPQRDSAGVSHRQSLKEGMKKEEVRTRFLPRQEQAVADGMLAYYEKVERIKIVNGLVSLFKFKVKLDEEASRMMKEMEKIYLDGAMLRRPPRMYWPRWARIKKRPSRCTTP